MPCIGLLDSKVPPVVQQVYATPNAIASIQSPISITSMVLSAWLSDAAVRVPAALHQLSAALHQLPRGVQVGLVTAGAASAVFVVLRLWTKPRPAAHPPKASITDRFNEDKVHRAAAVHV